MNGQSSAARLGFWLSLSLSLTVAPARAQDAPLPIGAVSDLIQTCAAYVKPSLDWIMGGYAGHDFTGRPSLLQGKVKPGWNHPNAQEARGELAAKVVYDATHPERLGFHSLTELQASMGRPLVQNEPSTNRFELCVVQRRAQQIAAESRAQSGASATATVRPAQGR